MSVGGASSSVNKRAIRPDGEVAADRERFNPPSYIQEVEAFGLGDLSKLVGQISRRAWHGGQARMIIILRSRRQIVSARPA